MQKRLCKQPLDLRTNSEMIPKGFPRASEGTPKGSRKGFASIFVGKPPNNTSCVANVLRKLGKPPRRRIPLRVRIWHVECALACVWRRLTTRREQLREAVAAAEGGDPRGARSHASPRCVCLLRHVCAWPSHTPTRPGTHINLPYTPRSFRPPLMVPLLPSFTQ